jgi:hypothetical protein
MNDRTWVLCEEALHKALARNGVADPGQALCALLWLLRGRHQADVTALARRAYRKDFELLDPRARTVAERIQDLAARTAGGHGHETTRGYYPDAIAPGIQVVADVLGELIPLWDFEAMEEAVALGDNRCRVSLRERVFFRGAKDDPVDR